MELGYLSIMKKSVPYFSLTIAPSAFSWAVDRSSPSTIGHPAARSRPRPSA
jgi:hypothetical protein